MRMEQITSQMAPVDNEVPTQAVAQANNANNAVDGGELLVFTFQILFLQFSCVLRSALPFMSGHALSLG